jgi:two-component system phosphate regulon sensor histidine kinase PhoR
LADALVVLDESQRIRFCNPAFEQFAGNGRKISTGAALSEVLRDIDTAQTIESVLKENVTRSTEVTRADKCFQLVAMPVLRRGQEPNGIVAVFHDISRLKQTDEIQRDFVANVSHELRTPLSIFRGNLEVLLDDQDLSAEERHQIFSAMKRHSDRLNRLIEDLLALARLEAKEVTLQIAPVDLTTFLERAARDWNKRMQNRDLKIQVSVDENLPLLLADEFRLEQVMHNLLENAVSYSAEGKTISIVAKSEEGRAILSVADQGIGIPPTDLPRIFERFYRADRARSRERGGTGLGLSIVKHIAQLHGGDVRAESELGKGTRVSVLLPWEANCLRNCNKVATPL